MKVSIAFDADNDAFSEGNAGEECARIFRVLADLVQDWSGSNEFSLAILDANGNKVGRLRVTQ